MNKKMEQIGFLVCGTTPLIQNHFQQKSIEAILSKHMKMPVRREKKVPRQVIADARIVNTAGEVCIPAVAMKCAMITGSANLKTFDKMKKQLMIALHVEGQGLPIDFAPSDSPEARALGLGCEPRMDMVRLSGPARTPDVRFRPQFNGWSCKFVVTYSTDVVSDVLVTQLVDLAGRVGVGEFRPERKGIYGQFAIDRPLNRDELDAAIAASSIPLETPRIPAWALDADVDEEVLARMFDGSAAGVDERMAALKNGAKSNAG